MLNDRQRLRRLGASGQAWGEAELVRLPRIEQARVIGACTVLSWGAHYCLGLGFRDGVPDYDALLAVRPGRFSGDLPYRNWVEQRVSMTRSARLEQQRLEVRDAVRGLGKARALS